MAAQLIPGRAVELLRTTLAVTHCTCMHTLRTGLSGFSAQLTLSFSFVMEVAAEVNSLKGNHALPGSEVDPNNISTSLLQESVQGTPH